MPRPSLMLLMLTAALLPGAALAQKPDKPGKKPGTSAAAAQPTITLTFTTQERRVLTDYYREHPIGAKPLPPGIAKNLERGKPMPPGIAKRQIPPIVLTALPPRPGFERVIIGNSIVLINPAGLVVDMLSGILH